MATIVQGCISLISGLVISFLFGWQMSLVTLSVFVVLLGLQILLNRTVHVRDRRDIRYAEEAGKVHCLLKITMIIYHYRDNIDDGMKEEFEIGSMLISIFN